MALSRGNAQVKWSTNDSKSVTGSTIQWSDAVSLNDADVAMSLTVKADLTGTPQAGDTCSVYIAWSTGDISGGAGADTFDSDKHGQPIMVLDTNVEDLATATRDIPVSAKSFKVGVLCPQAGTRNITVYAHYAYQRAA